MTDQEKIAKLEELTKQLLKTSNDYAGRIAGLEQRLTIAEAHIKASRS